MPEDYDEWREYMRQYDEDEGPVGMMSMVVGFILGFGVGLLTMWAFS